MEKAKIALTVVAVLAVVGGAVAFKTNRQGSFLYTREVNQLNCTKLVLTPYIIDALATTTIRATTTPVVGDCPTIKVRFDD